MKFRIIPLILFFITGFTFMNCNSDDPISCQSSFTSFFEIEGINLSHQTTDDLSGVNFSNYKGIQVDYQLNYLSSNTRRSFSFINTAMASNLIILGAQNERVTGIEITTINDFDAEHLAGSSLSDIMQASIYGETSIDQLDFSNLPFIDHESFLLSLLSQPTSNEEFKAKVKITISTGDSYEVETSGVTFLQ